MENYEYSGKTVEDAITKACVDLGVTSDEIEYEVVEKGSKGLFNLGSKDAVIRLTSVKGEPCGEPAPAPAAAEAPASEPAPAAEALEAPDAAEAPEAAETPVTSLSSSAAAEDSHEEHHHHEAAGPSDPAVVGIAEAFLKEVFDAMKLEVKMDSTLDAANNVLSIELSGPEMGIIIGKRGQTLDSLQYITSLAVNRKTSPYTRIKIDTEDYRERRKATLENLAKNVASKVKRTGRPAALESMNPYERRIIHFALQDNPYVETHSEGEEPYRHVVVTPKND